MKIQNIQTVDFQRKLKARTIISQEMKEDVQKLMYNMNHDAKYEQSENGNCYESYIIRVVKIVKEGKKVLFKDNRFLCAPTEKTHIYDHSDCSMEFEGNKLDINSQTGEVFVSKKTFWKTKKRVIKQGLKYIKIGTANYDNPDVVKKKSMIMIGFTNNGAKIVEATMRNIGLG